MLKFRDWINRMRHNRGFGMQSPTAFFFVTQVLKEKLPYYAYKDIDHIAKQCGTHSKKWCRRLFRIANYLHPKSIIAMGTDAEAPLCALAAAATTAEAFLITEKKSATATAEEFFANREIHKLCGSTTEQLKELLQAGNALQMLFIGKDCDIASTLQIALQHTCNSSAIIIDGIHTSPERLKLWEATVNNPQTIVTYDMYSLGILFFDNEKHKQHYTLKM